MFDGIPANGPNPAKAQFFAEVATGMQFLSLFWSLSKEDQQELMDQAKSFQAAAAPLRKDKR